MKSARIISSVAAQKISKATPFISRATPHPACMPALFSKAASPRSNELPLVSVVEKEVRAIAENDLIRWSSRPDIALVRLLQDDTLRVCYDLSGKKLPTEFKTKADTKLYLVTYKRKKK